MKHNLTLYSILRLVQHHGYEPFVNTDGRTVSWYISDNTGQERLLTAGTIGKALRALGY